MFFISLFLFDMTLCWWVTRDLEVEIYFRFQMIMEKRKDILIGFNICFHIIFGYGVIYNIRTIKMIYGQKETLHKNMLHAYNRLQVNTLFQEGLIELTIEFFFSSKFKRSQKNRILKKWMHTLLMLRIHGKSCIVILSWMNTGLKLVLCWCFFC